MVYFASLEDFFKFFQNLMHRLHVFYDLVVRKTQIF